jgi:hypothetical protein
MDPREMRAAREAQLSHNEIHSVLRAALRERHPDAWVYFEDIYDDHAIYTVEPKNTGAEDPGGLRFYDAAYVINADGTVTIGDPVEVRRVVNYVPVTVGEALTPVHSDLVAVREALAVTEAAGQKRRLKVIEPGWGSSGYWSAEVLERDGPAAFPAGTQMFVDHQTEAERDARPEGSLRDLAAVFDTDAVFDAAGEEGPGLYAEATVVEPWVPLIDAVAGDIGVSVSTYAESSMGEAEGRKGPIIGRIVSAAENPFNSVDFVTKPGAGGRVLAVVESLRPKSGSPQPVKASHDGTTPSESAEPAKEAPEMDEKLKEELEAAKRRVTELETANEALTTENGALREKVAIGEARGIVAAKLGGSELPEITQTRLTESLVRTVKLAEDGALDAAALEAATDAAIAAEADYIAKLTESGKVTGQGDAHGTPVEAEAVRESFKSRYLAQGFSEEQAERMAATAAAGR